MQGVNAEVVMAYSVWCSIWLLRFSDLQYHAMSDATQVDKLLQLLMYMHKIQGRDKINEHEKGQR